jgi:quercetin dioxygenase-like cupin family protein
MSPDPHPNSLTVADLNEAVELFTRRLGFRLDMIVPADAPQTALLSGQGVTLRLQTAAPQTASRLDDNAEFITHRATDVWHEGRAGMQYRDLIPSRLDGRLIASHIRIPAGGAVPDYVHYHKVRFQMIYCRAGWVRVVYEDQGPPFVLAAGDCVLQPPEIRHRVLEASPGLEVIEVGCPAIHETWLDHELPLPTQNMLPERSFNGQRFVRHRADEANWLPWHLAGFAARDTGIAAATNGLAAVRVVRAEAAVTATVNKRASEVLFLFILQGDLNVGAQTNQALQAGDSCVILADEDYTLRAAAGLEFLEVRLPADLSPSHIGL